MGIRPLTYLFVFLVCVSFASALQVASIQATDCRFVGTAYSVCGDTKQLTCNVLLNSPDGNVFVSSVKFGVKVGTTRTTIDAALNSGTSVNGTWTSSIYIGNQYADVSQIDFELVSVRTTSGSVCNVVAPGESYSNCYGVFSAPYRLTNDCSCTFSTEFISSESDNSCTYLRVPSSGCSSTSYQYTEFCDYCDPVWTPTYGSCSWDLREGLLYFKGTTSKDYYAANQACYLTGNDIWYNHNTGSDRTPPIDHDSSVLCSFTGWYGMDKDAFMRGGDLVSKDFAVGGLSSILVSESSKYQALVWDVDENGMQDIIMFTDTHIKIYSSEGGLKYQYSVGGTIAGQPALWGVDEKVQGSPAFKSFVVDNGPLLVVPVSAGTNRVYAYTMSSSGISLYTNGSSTADNISGVSCFGDFCYYMSAGTSFDSFTLYKLNPVTSHVLFSSGSQTDYYGVGLFEDNFDVNDWDTYNKFSLVPGAVPIIHPMEDPLEITIHWPRLNTNGVPFYDAIVTDSFFLPYIRNVATPISDFVSGATRTGAYIVRSPAVGTSITYGRQVVGSFEETVSRSGSSDKLYLYVSRMDFRTARSNLVNLYGQTFTYNPQIQWVGDRSSAGEGISNVVSTDNGFAVELNTRTPSEGVIPDSPFDPPAVVRAVTSDRVFHMPSGPAVTEDLNLLFANNIVSGSYRTRIYRTSDSVLIYENIYNSYSNYITYALKNNFVFYSFLWGDYRWIQKFDFADLANVVRSHVTGWVRPDYGLRNIFYIDDVLYGYDYGNAYMNAWSFDLSSSSSRQLSSVGPSVNSNMVWHDVEHDMVLHRHFFYPDFLQRWQNDSVIIVSLPAAISGLAFNYDYDDAKYITEGGQLVEINSWQPLDYTVYTGQCINFYPVYWNSQSYVLGVYKSSIIGGTNWAYCDYTNPYSPVMTLIPGASIPVRTQYFTSPTVQQLSSDYTGAQTGLRGKRNHVLLLKGEYGGTMYIYDFDSTRMDVNVSLERESSRLVTLSNTLAVRQTIPVTYHPVNNIGMGSNVAGRKVYTSSGYYDTGASTFVSLALGDSVIAANPYNMQRFQSIDINADGIVDLITHLPDSNQIRIHISSPSASSIIEGANVDVRDITCTPVQNTNNVNVRASIVAPDPNDVFIMIDKGDGTGFSSYPVSASGIYTLSYSAPGVYNVVFSAGDVNSGLAGIEGCTVDVDFSTVDACSLGASGEFNFLEPVTSHGWTVRTGIVTPKPYQGKVSLQRDTLITHPVVGCDYEVVAVEFGVVPETLGAVYVFDSSGSSYGISFINNVLFDEAGNSIGTYSSAAGGVRVARLTYNRVTKDLTYIYNNEVLATKNLQSFNLVRVGIQGPGDFDFVRILKSGELIRDPVAPVDSELPGTISDKIHLTKCNNEVMQNYTDRDLRRSYPNVGAYCQFTGRCTYTDLALINKEYPNCAKETWNYCVYVTYPAAENIASGQGSTSAATTCAIHLSTSTGFSQIVAPSVSGIWTIVTMKPVITLLVILLFVIVVPPIVMSRRR